MSLKSYVALTAFCYCDSSAAGFSSDSVLAFLLLVKFFGPVVKSMPVYSFIFPMSYC